MLDNIKVYKQNSIKIDKIYIDPYGVTDNLNDAEYIFITHSHYDHYSDEDILKVVNDETVFIMPSSMKNEYHYANKVLYVEPNNSYQLDDISFKTIRMYNIDKPFHPKDNNWCGYIISYNDNKYYVMGDTDNTPDINNINCNIVFIPIGGKFTMTLDEAINCLDKIEYDYVIPVHYGSIVGANTLGEDMKKIIGDKCVVKIK